MSQREHAPGQCVLFSSFRGEEAGKEPSFCDQEAIADSQLERAMDLRNCGFPIAGIGLRERIKYYFLKNFVPFWVK